MATLAGGRSRTISFKIALASLARRVGWWAFLPPTPSCFPLFRLGARHAVRTPIIGIEI